MPRLLLLAISLLAPLTFAAPPNVVLIAIDDLNDFEGFLGGHPQARTPHMDALAARGVVFTNAHCQAPLCNSSRTSLLMGLRPSTTGVYALDPWFRTDPKYKDWVTLPQHFARGGYTTLATGKIYHDAYPPKEGRVDGTEFSVWGPHENHGPIPPRKFVTTPDAIKLMDWGVFPERDEELGDHKVATWAAERLKSMPRDKPFFLSVGFRRPHVPCFAPQKWFDLYPESEVQLPPIKADDRADTPRFSWYTHWKLPEPRTAWMERAGELRKFVRAYLACVSFVDEQVGRVVRAIDDAGLGENTIIVLFSDHGYHLGEKGVTGKNTLWERSTRVPLIVVAPGVSKVGGRCAEPAELLDIYPTLADLAGGSLQNKLDGRSLRDQLVDPAKPSPRLAITTQGPGNHAVRSRDWRFIQYADGSRELYDLKADPNEWANLAGDSKYTEVITEHAKWLPTDVKPMAGSKTRLIEVKEGVPYWQGQPIGKDEPVPGVP